MSVAFLFLPLSLIPVLLLALLLLALLLFPDLLFPLMLVAGLLFALLLLALFLFALLLFFLLGSLSQYGESLRTTNRLRRNDSERKAKEKGSSTSDRCCQESVCRGCSGPLRLFVRHGTRPR